MARLGCVGFPLFKDTKQQKSWKKCLDQLPEDTQRMIKSNKLIR